MPNLVGTKWGNSKLGTPGGTVTWSIAGSGEDISRFGYSTERSVSGDSFLDYNYSKVIAEAFAEWSKYGDIEFKQVADQGGAAGVGKTADIRIFFGAIPGGTVGYAYFPSKWGSAIAGDILMDTISLFNKDPGWFKAVMLHEIGHALGLDHVSSNSIMTPTIKKIGLQPDDIAGIQKIYGVQQDAPSEPDPEPAPQPKPQPEPEEPAAGTQPDPEPAPAPKPNTGDDERLVGDGGKDRIKGGDGDDTILGKGGNDSLYGGDDDDRLEGGGGNDYLKGESGNDYIKGESGKDVLVGNSGRDKLYGGDSADRLNGGSGSDTLEGGRGNDVIIGSGGSDIFVFDDGHGHDKITDFRTASSSEKIDLSDLNGFDRFGDVRDAASQEGKNVLIETGSNSSILLQNVSLSALDSSDFLF